MNAKETASRILKEVGGEENVQYLTHCVTRLRFNLHSMENVSENRIKNIPGVVGVVNKGGQFQVIIGQEVVSVYNALLALGDFSTGAASKSQGGQNQGGQNLGGQVQCGQGQGSQGPDLGCPDLARPALGCPDFALPDSGLPGAWTPPRC